MRSFLKFLLVLFMMMVTISIQPSDFCIKENSLEPIIQTPVNEKLILVSNNLFGGEVFANSEENDSNFGGNSLHFISVSEKLNYYIKNNICLNGSFIHNLSANNQKVHQIRAP